jgi:hypothetical protein
MAVVNADAGQVATTLPIGDHVDATAFDPESRVVFNSKGEGTVTIIRQETPDKYSALQNVKIPASGENYGARSENSPTILDDSRGRTICSFGGGEMMMQRSTNRLRLL